MKKDLPPGRSPALSWRDFPRESVVYGWHATGVVRATNTKHGARILVEVVRLNSFPGGTTVRREFFVNLKSHSYVRLCEIFGDNLAKWNGEFFARVVRHPGDRRSRVEVA